MNFLKKAKGFSLIEVLVALVILAISLLALAGLMVTTTKNNSSGAHVTEAATFAQDKLEELKVTPWANIVTGLDTVGGPLISTGISYARSWTVATDGTGNVKTITITISWTDKVSHSIQLLSVVSL